MISFDFGEFDEEYQHKKGFVQGQKYDQFI